MNYSRLHPEWVSAIAGSGVDLDSLYLEVDRLYQGQSSNVSSGSQVYPARSLVFRAFHETLPDRVRVVVVGQDPYPTPNPQGHSGGIADGLSFSARSHEPPPSLRHIFYNLWTTGEMSRPPGGADLQSWAKAGVLLLNASLTVEPSRVTNVAYRNRRRHNRVYAGLVSATLSYLARASGVAPAFLRLGGDAREFKVHLRGVKPGQLLELHHPSKEPWPSPGEIQDPFVQINSYLGIRAINWQV